MEQYHLTTLIGSITEIAVQIIWIYIYLYLHMYSVTQSSLKNSVCWLLRAALPYTDWSFSAENDGVCEGTGYITRFIFLVFSCRVKMIQEETICLPREKTQLAEIGQEPHHSSIPLRSVRFICYWPLIWQSTLLTVWELEPVCLMWGQITCPYLRCRLICLFFLFVVQHSSGKLWDFVFFSLIVFCCLFFPAEQLSLLWLLWQKKAPQISSHLVTVQLFVCNLFVVDCRCLMMRFDFSINIICLFVVVKAQHLVCAVQPIYSDASQKAFV